MSRPLPEEGPSTAGALADGLLDGDRRSLARAITLVESTRLDHRAQAEALLALLLDKTGKSIRIGISGVPGVGKSTFIESFGRFLIDRGHRVAVLAVDPSSQVTGGSILGDKTRMEQLAQAPEAFIRPSPAAGTLGGVARRTHEAMLLCEAAGFDVVIVETVGVGQSETAVAEMVDLFLLLLPPAGGDELQGIKKGIVELADLLVVNKDDGDLRAAVRRAVAEYTAALHLLRPASASWRPRVLSCSALEGQGMEDIWLQIEAFRQAREDSGEFAERRAEQAHAWMWREVHEGLVQAVDSDPGVTQRLEVLERQVAQGRLHPAAAAQELIALFRRGG